MCIRLLHTHKDGKRRLATIQRDALCRAPDTSRAVACGPLTHETEAARAGRTTATQHTTAARYVPLRLCPSEILAPNADRQAV